MNYPATLLNKTLNAVITLVLAFVVSKYVSFTHQYWLVLAAFLVNQSMNIAFIRQSIVLVIAMMVAITIAIFFNATSLGQTLLYVVISILFVFSALSIYWSRPVSAKTFLQITIFPLLLLFAAYSPNLTSVLKDQFADIVIGSFIGVICGYFAFPYRLGAEFKVGVIPVLQSALSFSNLLEHYFLNPDNNKSALSIAQIQVENDLVSSHSGYPEWVYESGFNPGLRGGFRFFLINIDRVIELLFSINYVSQEIIKSDFISTIKAELAQIAKNNGAMLSSLISYFENNEIKDLQSNMTSDIAELEIKVNEIVPPSLELIDISPDYVKLITLVRDIKDIRQLLLQLLMALPNK